MPPAGRFALYLAVLGLTATLATVPVATAGTPRPAILATTSLNSPDADRETGGFTPRSGVVLNDPMSYGRKRLIINRVIRSIENTAAGEYIRIAVWGYEDKATTDAVVDAHQRGVHVQIVVANGVINTNWFRTYAVLNEDKEDQSFAVRCSGGCRSPYLLHAKFVLISRVGQARNVSMVGSFNLTKRAALRQWNDMVTSRQKDLYRALVRTFSEYARDRTLANPFRVANLGKEKLTVWPSGGRNTIRQELDRVRCKIPPHAVRNGQRRTKIRIAIAGWFDDYGTHVARRLRTLWGQGCNVKIITTRAGAGVKRALRGGGGRGPVPIRQVSVDRNHNGTPELYLHMKAMAITGVFGGDPRADVLFTGSPNWSRRAQRSDEIIVRYRDVPLLARKYSRHVDRLFSSRWAHRRTTSDAFGDRKDGESPPPAWFELD